MQAHVYLDHLLEGQVSAVRALLEAMLDPVSRSLANAPVEDEEISSEEEQAVTESVEWRKHNRPISNEEVFADLGLASTDFERMAVTPLYNLGHTIEILSLRHRKRQLSLTWDCFRQRRTELIFNVSPERLPSTVTVIHRAPPAGSDMLARNASLRI